uniref:Putative ENHANCER OF AG-4 protein 2 isoform X2 n=1 Tax=Davidia involucrata TaxID=16924 RepID=A0A5B7A4W9_DAVIN
MAPGRKRGAKGAKAKSELSLGDLVLAKVKGFPAWPAKISRPEDWKRTPDPKKYFVQFFGTAEIAFVAPADIQEFTSEAKSKLSARCQGKTVKYFAQAVKEICEAFEELERKNSSGLRDDSDRSALGSEAPSVDGVEDDAAEVDLKAGIATDGSKVKTEIRGLGDHGSGLERCSQRQGEMDSRDIKPSISCDVDDSFSPVTSSKKKNKLSNEGVHVQKVSTSSPYNPSCLKEEVSCDKNEDKVICCEPSKVTEGLNASQSNRLSDVEEDSSTGLVCGKKDSSSPLVVSVRDKNYDSGRKALTNGHKSDKKAIGSRRKCEGAFEVRKSSSSAVLTPSKYETTGGHVDLPESGDAKDGIKRKIALGGSAKELSPEVLKEDIDVNNGKKVKKLLKAKKHFEVADDVQNYADGSSDEQAKGDLAGRKKRAQLGHGKHNLVTNEVPHPAKRSKRADVADDAAKLSLQMNRKSDSRSSSVLDKRADNAELKRSTSHVKAENRLASKTLTGNEDVLPPPKRRRQALEAMSDSATITSEDKMEKHSTALKHDVSCSDNVKSPAPQLHTKRRGVRLCDDDDDDDEEPKTPIHGGSARKVHAPSCVSHSIKNTDVHHEGSIQDQPSIRDSGGLEDGPSKECLPSAKLLNESLSPNPQLTVEKKLKKAMTAQISHSPGKLESEGVSSKEAKPISVSPKRSPLSGAAVKPVVEPHKANKPSVKVPSAGIQKIVQAGSSKGSGMASDGLNSSQNQATIQRSKLIASGERRKATPKSNAWITDSALAEGNTMENNLLPGERLEAGTDDKTSSLIDLKIADPVMSMKHLIAAAQAKRRQTHSQNLSHGNPNSDLAPSTDVPWTNLSPASTVQPFLFGSSNVMQPDIQGCYPCTSLASPSSHGHQFSSNNQPDTEEFEERRVSSGHQHAGGSLSGGTEAAVARDAFEGMIETLSRTKESIGRATRLAIDCAKYGIANEVVELLIRKLESEPSFHRKVDLFFLVDSITQCSHSHKGIAGASYIPTVQAALPRLLGAAAPPGAAARENRRQCLKVLRLWLERKILPEPLLRRYMDDIGVSNDDTSAGFFLRRPSRAERAVDDPIREMDGMLVDEYGSNATFQLPGFLSSHVFEEEEEEEDLPSSTCKETGDGSPVAATPATGELETCTVTPNDRRHCILEDVDGELEMEDVSGHPKDERPLFANGSFKIASQQQGSERIMEAVSSNSAELPHLPEGSPPLPLDSPPQTPPLPPSPPPLPPPPPLSPLPPPPLLPPLPSQPHPLSLPPSGPPPSLLPQPLPPQPLIVSQQLHPPQSSIPSSPKLAYQPPVLHEYCNTTSGNQHVQMAANAPQGGHIDQTVRSELFLQQSPCFVPAGVCNTREPSGFNSSRPSDIGRNDLYINPQASQPNQHFQPGNAPFVQRPFHPAPPPQTPSSHYSYSNPTIQQHPQHPYPRPYSLPNLPDAPRRYVADEQWRMSTSEFDTDNQRGVWLSGGRTPSCSGPPFPQDGYFRPPLERPPTNNVGFQPSAPNTLPAGAPIPGDLGM